MENDKLVDDSPEEVADEVVEDTTEDEVQDDEEEATPDASDEDDTDWKAEALKYKSINERLNKKMAKPQVAPSKQRSDSSDNDIQEKFERLELKTDGYSDDEVDWLMGIGGKSALKNKFTVRTIEAMRREAKSKDANPPIAAKSPIYKKHTKDELEKMSVEELEKILPHL